MKTYQSTFLTNILIFALGLVLIISPTALTSGSVDNTYSFYPDLFLCFIFSTNFNRPKTINLYLVLLLLLFSDVLHMKPIGLLTALVLFSFIVIERFQKQIKRSSFFTQYFIFFMVISFVQMLNLVLHQLFFLPDLSLITIVKQTIFTLICYPLFDIPYKLIRTKTV